LLLTLFKRSSCDFSSFSSVAQRSAADAKWATLEHAVM